MPDKHADLRDTKFSPSTTSEAVDISAGDHVFTNTTTCLHVAAAGNITVEELGAPGVPRLFRNVQAGQLQGRFLRVYQTGTTLTDAGDILGRW